MKLWKRITLIVVGVIVLIVVAAHLYLFELGGLESLVVDEVETALPDESPFSVFIGDIKGNMFTGITLENVAVRYADSLRSFEFFRAERITAHYSLKNLLDADYSFSHLSLVKPRTVLMRDSSGATIPSLGSDSSKADQSGGATPAKPGSIDLSFAVDDLKIVDGQAVLLGPGDDSLTFDSFNMLGAVRYGGGSLSADIGSMGYTSSNSDYALSDVSGKLTYSGGNIVFQGLTVARGKLRIKLDGNLDVDSLVGSLEVNADNLDMEEVSAIIGAKLYGVIDINAHIDLRPGEIDARANLGGRFQIADFDNLYAELRYREKHLYLDTLYGTILNGCAVDGTGEVDFAEKPEKYNVSAEIRNFNLAELVQGSFESDLSGRLDLDGESFSNETLELRLDVDLYESTFDEYPLQLAQGPLVITTDSLWFPAPFTIEYYENSFEAEGTVVYSGDISLDVAADLGNLDRYRGKLFIDQPGGRGISHASLTGKTNDPDLRGWFASDSLWIYGLYADTAYASFTIDRFLTGRQGGVEVDLFSGSAWQIPYDSAYAGIRLDSLQVTMDTVGFRSEYANFGSRGRFDQEVYPWELSIDSLHLTILDREFYNRSRLKIGIDSLGFVFQQTAIGDDTKVIGADRRVNFDETMDLSLNASGIQVAHWLQLFQQKFELEGVLSGQAELAGSFESPEFELTGTLDSIFYRDVNVGRLSAATRYRDGLLTADSLVIRTDSGGLYRARGHFPANLAFTSVATERLPDAPFDLEFTAQDKQFDLLYLLMPSVEQLDGMFKADVRLTGTIDDPHLDGQAWMTNASLKYFDLVDRIKADSVRATLADSVIHLEPVTAYVERKDKKRAEAKVSGDLIVKTLDSLVYDLNVNIPRNMPFRYDLDDIEGVVRGNVAIKGQTPPLVSGDLVLDECRYRVEFAGDETGSPLMLALSGEDSWDLDVNIEIPSNYWIKNEDIDAEFAGYLNVIRERGKYRFIGELEILRGKGYLFDKTFRFVSDSARVIFEDIEHFNPRLDLWATSRIPVSRSAEEERSYQDLKVHVTGTLESPEYSFYEEGSDVALSYSAIVPLIVANYYGDETGGSKFEERVSSLIASQVSQLGTRHLGVETFEINPAYEGNLDLGQTRVAVGLYTGTSLYLWGSSEVTSSSQAKAGFEYRLSRGLMLEGYRDADRVEGESYHLNFKVHTEW